jgi:hypothetical protein
MRIEDERDRVCRQGAEAWRRLKRDKNWGDWVKVGDALLVGREWAMDQAGTNQPQGKGYNMAFGEWMQRYKLDDMDKGDRSRLFMVMDNLGQIEEWRRTLTLTERLKLNHPNAILRKWKAHMEPERKPDGPPKPTLRDSVANLSEENASLKAHIAELEAARAAGKPDLATALAVLVDEAKRATRWADVMPADAIPRPAEIDTVMTRLNTLKRGRAKAIKVAKAADAERTKVQEAVSPYSPLTPRPRQTEKTSRGNSNDLPVIEPREWAIPLTKPRSQR